MKLEICIDAVEGAHMAAIYSADRVELCSALSIGGLTPSLGLIEKCAEYIDVHAMLRPREGNFIYSQDEVESMVQDIDHMAQSGAKGVVFGCLTVERNIDLFATKLIAEKAGSLGMATTFHRAFDFCVAPYKALENLIDLGINRLLTSGQKKRAIEGKHIIKELVEASNGRIEIMAGSGVNQSNAKELAEIGVDALHFTSHLEVSDKNGFGMGVTTVPDRDKIFTISKLFK